MGICPLPTMGPTTKNGSPLVPNISHKCNVTNQRLRDGGSPINYTT